MQVLAICGSLRAASLNRWLLQAAAAAAPAGMTVEIAGIEGIPVFDEDLEKAGMPAAVATLRARIGAADALVIATPEYNWSIPGGLKNAVDWLSRRVAGAQPFAGKPVALMGVTSGTGGTINAQAHLRQVLYPLGAQVLPPPGVFVQAGPSRFDADGRLTDEATRQVVAGVMAALAKAIG